MPRVFKRSDLSGLHLRTTTELRLNDLAMLLTSRSAIDTANIAALATTEHETIRFNRVRDKCVPERPGYLISETRAQTKLDWKTELLKFANAKFFAKSS